MVIKKAIDRSCHPSTRLSHLFTRTSKKNLKAYTSQPRMKSKAAFTAILLALLGSSLALGTTTKASAEEICGRGRRFSRTLGGCVDKEGYQTVFIPVNRNKQYFTRTVRPHRTIRGNRIYKSQAKDYSRIKRIGQRHRDGIIPIYVNHPGSYRLIRKTYKDRRKIGRVKPLYVQMPNNYDLSLSRYYHQDITNKTKLLNRYSRGF